MSIEAIEHAPLPPETSFHFVLCAHSSENAAAVAESLGDCDVIAFEQVGHSRKERAEDQALYTMYVASDTTEEKRRAIEACWDYPDDDIGFILTVLKNVQHSPDSDPKVVLVDAAEGDYAHTRHKNAVEATETYIKKHAEGTPADELREPLHTKIVASAVSIIQRERLVMRQLENLALEQPGARIGVVLGAVHTAVQHHMDVLHKTDRRFVTPSLMSDAKTLTFDPENVAVRQLRFNIGTDIDAKTLDYILLQRLLQATYGLESPKQLKDFSAEELPALITQVDSRRQRMYEQDRTE